MRKAFTLIELLVVIGIIAILLAVLLPTLSRVREAGRQSVCLSNIRQIGIAFINYLGQNRGVFPNGSEGIRRQADWIYWQQGDSPRQLEDSSIASYLARPLTSKIFTCPSDDVSTHTNWFWTFEGSYRFSYAANKFLVGDAWTNQRPIKVNRVHYSSEIIMLVEESDKTINDGTWVPEKHDPEWDFLAIRHDRFAKERIPSIIGFAGKLEHPGRRGNVVFVDGHGDFVDRSYAHNPRHYLP